MNGMTLEQLRESVRAGGVNDVTLKGRGGSFTVEIEASRGPAQLVTARGTAPRRFRNPSAAMMVLRDAGIDEARLDTRDWAPVRRRPLSDDDRPEPRTHTEWLAAELEKAMNDPRPSIPHEVVMAELEAELEAIARRAENSGGDTES